MANINYNVRQITDTTIPNNAYVKPFTFAVREYNPITQIWEYVGKTRDYYVINDLSIVKLGYCCEPKGIDYPIYFKFEDVWNANPTPYYTRKNGIYEMQIENFKDANDISAKELDIMIEITGIAIPKDIKFTLDYVVKPI